LKTTQGYDGRTADIWSCGVVLYVLLAAFLPFDEPTLVALFNRIQRADFSYPSCVMGLCVVK
jgi:serine/threonine protein kinase